MWSCSSSLIFVFHTGTNKSQVPFPPCAPAFTQKLATFMNFLCSRERQAAQQGPATSDLEKLWFHSVQHSLLSPSSPKNEKSCARWSSSSRLRVAAESPRTRPAQGAVQGWPTQPECWAQGAAGGAEAAVVPGWHTGQAQTLGAKPCPKTRAQMGRRVSDPEQVVHVLKGCDLSLEEVEIRYPACSLPRAALGEAGDGPMVQLHEKSQHISDQREIGEKRWRRIGNPQWVICHLQDQSEQSV